MSQEPGITCKVLATCFQLGLPTIQHGPFKQGPLRNGDDVRLPSVRLPSSFKNHSSDPRPSYVTIKALSIPSKPLITHAEAFILPNARNN